MNINVFCYNAKVHEYIKIIEGDFMKYKKITALIVMAALLCTCVANASILGSEAIQMSSLEIGHGATLNTNIYYSDQSGVGYQTENYVEYSPNSNLLPVIINNTYLCDRASVSSKGNSLVSYGTYPAMLMNADYFSMDMGFPVSNQAVDGKIIVQDYQTTDALGINSDGTAFIAPLTISTQITLREYLIPITVINMARQDWGIFLFTDKFATTTKASTDGINIVVGSLSGDISIGETQTGIVEEIIETKGAVEIPKGKIVISADNNAPEYIYNAMRLFAPGDEIQIATTAEGDDRFNDAKYILGTVGGRLLTNSEITITDASAAPRSAVGIKKDGTLVFYTIDGRQSGHSYGVRLHTLANRMKELGCVDAINLDGGGSTTMGIIKPGNSKLYVVNSPSDGSERKIPNYIALINTLQKTSVPQKLFVYPYTGNYLSGTNVTFSAYATDENYYKTDTPENIVYTSSEGSVSTDGSLTLKGNGEITVTASANGLTGTATVNCYESPTHISLTNTKTNKLVDQLEMLTEESISLSPIAKFGNKYLIDDSSCYVWSCSENIGTIDQMGNFKATNKAAQGEITVSAGKYIRTIPVTINKENKYTDIFFTKESDRSVKIEFNTNAGDSVDESNIIVKIDGKEIQTKLTDGNITLNFDDEKMHKINVQVMNSSGYKTVAAYTLNGESYHNPFDDISETYWAKDCISYMHYHKIVSGTTDGSKRFFNPSNNITRGEFAVMAANVMGIDVSAFEDVIMNISDEDTIPAWCINHIKALWELGIMNGKQAGDKIIFDSTATLTRAEAAAVISRLLPENLMTEERVFTDSEDIPTWCKDAFTKLTSLKIINGYSDGSIRPTNNTTRAEVIKMLYEIY